MVRRGVWSLGSALVCATVAVVLAHNWMQAQVPPAAAVEDRPRMETAKVVVAAAPLRFGHEVGADDLRLVDWPKAALPEGTFGSVEDLVGEDAPGTRLVLRAIERDEPVLRAKISGFGARPSLSTALGTGMRAATIRVNDVVGVAGFVLPGDRVDVLLTRDSAGGRRATDLVTDVLLQNVRVLAIDQDANEGRHQPGVAKAVTLEVAPVETQKLSLARKLGTLSLALRHVDAPNVDAPKTVTARDLKAGRADAAATERDGPSDHANAEPKRMTPVGTPKAKPARTSVRVVRGLEETDYEVRIEAPGQDPPMAGPVVPEEMPAAPAAPGREPPWLEPPAEHVSAVGTGGETLRRAEPARTQSASQ